MKILMMVLLCCVLIPYSEAVAHDGNDGWVTLNKFQLWANVYGDDIIRVSPRDGVYNPSGCKDPDSYFVNSKFSDENKKRMYTTLLSAIATRKTLKAFIATNKCEGDRPILQSVIIE